MMIILTSHLKIRLDQRGISESFIKKVLLKPDEKYFDTLYNRYIAIKRIFYQGKIRPVMVAYDIINKDSHAVTVHAMSEQEIMNKLNRKRWV